MARLSFSILERERRPVSATFVARAAIVAVVVPAATAAAWEKEAAAHGQHDQQWNQQCDSTEHFQIL